MELKFDSTSKLMLVIFIVLTSYLFVISIISLPFGINPGDNIFNFSESKESTLNIIALIISIGIGFVVSLIIKTTEQTRPAIHHVETQLNGSKSNHANETAQSSQSSHAENNNQKVSREDELRIMKKALSKDELLVLEEVEKAGEITQDSLRYRLEFSKAKVSAIITSLDRMGLIQRERQGKTYKVYLQKK